MTHDANDDGLRSLRWALDSAVLSSCVGCRCPQNQILTLNLYRQVHAPAHSMILFCRPWPPLSIFLLQSFLLLAFSARQLPPLKSLTRDGAAPAALWRLEAFQLVESIDVAKGILIRKSNLSHLESAIPGINLAPAAFQEFGQMI